MQAVLCDHCGEAINEDDPGAPYARVTIIASAGGSYVGNYHNSADLPCFATTYQALRDGSKFGSDYPDLAVQPAAVEAAPAS